MDSKRTWFTATDVLENHKELPIRQIYVWFVTSDRQIVIVGTPSKNQFPGGKPEEGETRAKTLEREMFEETGINVNEFDEEPEFFGYYLTENDVNPKWPSGAPYLQLRYLMKVNKHSSEISLSVNEREEDLDNISIVQFVPIDQLSEYIWWTKDTEETNTVMSLI